MICLKCTAFQLWKHRALKNDRTAPLCETKALCGKNLRSRLNAVTMWVQSLLTLLLGVYYSRAHAALQGHWGWGGGGLPRICWTSKRNCQGPAGRSASNDEFSLWFAIQQCLAWASTVITDKHVQKQEEIALKGKPKKGNYVWQMH